MKERVEHLRKQYPKGTKIELLEMDDVQAPPIGTVGTVYGVDDLGSLLVRWENGSSLSVIDGVDKLKRFGINEIRRKDIKRAIALFLLGGETCNMSRQNLN